MDFDDEDENILLVTKVTSEQKKQGTLKKGESVAVLSSAALQKAKKGAEAELNEDDFGDFDEFAVDNLSDDEIPEKAVTAEACSEGGAHSGGASIPDQPIACEGGLSKHSDEVGDDAQEQSEAGMTQVDEECTEGTEPLTEETGERSAVSEKATTEEAARNEIQQMKQLSPIQPSPSLAASPGVQSEPFGSELYPALCSPDAAGASPGVEVAGTGADVEMQGGEANGGDTEMQGDGDGDGEVGVGGEPEGGLGSAALLKGTNTGPTDAQQLKLTPSRGSQQNLNLLGEKEASGSALMLGTPLNAQSQRVTPDDHLMGADVVDEVTAGGGDSTEQDSVQQVTQQLQSAAIWESSDRNSPNKAQGGHAPSIEPTTAGLPLQGLPPQGPISVNNNGNGTGRRMTVASGDQENSGQLSKERGRRPPTKPPFPPIKEVGRATGAPVNSTASRAGSQTAHQPRPQSLPQKPLLAAGSRRHTRPVGTPPPHFAANSRSPPVLGSPGISSTLMGAVSGSACTALHVPSGGGARLFMHGGASSGGIPGGGRGSGGMARTTGGSGGGGGHGGGGGDGGGRRSGGSGGSAVLGRQAAVVPALHRLQGAAGFLSTPPSLAPAPPQQQPPPATATVSTLKQPSRNFSAHTGPPVPQALPTHHSTLEQLATQTPATITSTPVSPTPTIDTTITSSAGKVHNIDQALTKGGSAGGIMSSYTNEGVEVVQGCVSGSAQAEEDHALAIAQHSQRLDAMLVEARNLHDMVLETRVCLAMTSNRLARLDNPVLYEKLKDLKRKADMALAAADCEGFAAVV